MAKSSFWKAAGISLAIALVFTGCDDVLTQLKDELKLGQQTKQEKLDFSLVLENTEPEARYSAVIYGTDGAPVAGAEGTPLADDGVVFAFLVLPGEYGLKITEKAGAAKTTKTDTVVFVDGLPKVIIGWDGLLEADAGEAVTDVSDEEEAVEETDTEEEAVAEEPEAVEETDTEEEAVTDEPEAVEETDTEEEAVAEEPKEEPRDEPKADEPKEEPREEPKADEETDTEEDAVAEEPEPVKETDTEEETVAEEPEAVEETDTEEEAVAEEPVYRIDLTPGSTHHFPDAEVGYGTQTPFTYTVRNKGNQPTGDLSVELLDNAVLVDNGIASFVLSTDTIPSIPVGGTGTFTVVPRVGLDEGPYWGKNYTARIVLRGTTILHVTDTSVSFTVRPASQLSK